MKRPYVNFTLIRQDSSDLVNQAQSKASIHYKNAATSTKTIASDLTAKAADITAPYRQMAWEKYEEHLAETVDTSILPLVKPIYEDQVIPFANTCVGKSNELYALAWATMIQTHDTLHKWQVAEVNKQTSKIVQFLDMNEDEVYVPEFIKDFLRYVVDDTNDFIEICNTAFVVWMFHVLWWFIVQAVIVVVLLPFRIVWFFSPIRILFFRKKKMSKHDDNNDDGMTEEEPEPMPDTVHSNGGMEK